MLLSWHNYLLTPCSRVLHDKLRVSQLLKKFPAFYGTLSFINALTSVRHLSLSWANPIQSTYTHPTSCLEIHPNIIHPSTPRSPQWSLSPIRPPLLTHTRHMPSPSHSSRFYHPHDIGWEVQIIKLLVTHSPPFPRYLVPPRSKYDDESTTDVN